MEHLRSRQRQRRVFPRQCFTQWIFYRDRNGQQIKQHENIFKDMWKWDTMVGENALRMLMKIDCCSFVWFGHHHGFCGQSIHVFLLRGKTRRRTGDYGM